MRDQITVASRRRARLAARREQVATNLRAWADALESGAYRQAQGELRDADDQFCCLGVLCDLAARRGEGQWEGQDFILDRRHYDQLAPAALMARYGLEAHGGDHSDGVRADGGFWDFGAHRVVDLASANDTGRTFPEIAAALRRYAAELEGDQA